MSTPFTDIYKRAVREFDDPFISNTYGDTITFLKLMYNYLDNAIPLFVIPDEMVDKLEDIVDQSGETELFDGNGITDTFTLTTIPVANSYFVCLADGNTCTGVFDYTTNKIKLSVIPTADTENVSVEWYYPGNFIQTLNGREQRILSYLWVQNWAEKEKNHLLDIRRLLNDTDFKLFSEANSINSKGNWYIGLREEAMKLMKQYAWSLYQADLKNQYGLE